MAEDHGELQPLCQRDLWMRTALVQCKLLHREQHGNKKKYFWYFISFFFIRLFFICIMMGNSVHYILPTDPYQILGPTSSRLANPGKTHQPWSDHSALLGFVTSFEGLGLLQKCFSLCATLLKNDLWLRERQTDQFWELSGISNSYTFAFIHFYIFSTSCKIEQCK